MAAKTNNIHARLRVLMAASAVLCGLCGAARALADADPVEMTVVDRDSGQTLRTWRRHGRLFVAGAPGARYGLRVTNTTDARVLVVMSVDGVNILTGETGGYDQRGYVLGPHEVYDVNGWRKSNTEIAAFTFAPLPQSYAAQTGRPTDVGVIGMAVFAEKVVPPPPAVHEGTWPAGRAAQSLYKPPAPVGAPPPAPLAAPMPPPPAPPPPGVAARSASDIVVTAGRAAPPPPTAADKTRDEKLGTAHGAREWSYVTTVPFERATAYPWIVRRIEYDTYDHLVAAGVIPPSPPEGRRPQPFPNASRGGGYVPDPPGQP